MEFNEVADIFEVAVRIERHSVELYVSLFKSVRSSKARELFALLAAAEEKHLGQFRLLLEKAADYAPRYVYPGEYELFVDGIASRALDSFHRGARPLSSPTAVEAVRAGIELEEGSISFYTGLMDQFRGEDRALVEGLVSEERGHLSRLEELLASYPEAGGPGETAKPGDPRVPSGG